MLRRLTPVDVVELPLTVSYPTGQPGSSLTITGWHFVPNAQATLSINGQVLTTSLTINPTGSFILFLDTHSADVGAYVVTVSVNPSAKVSFILDDGAPLRPQEGGGLTFVVPAGIAYDHWVYFPSMGRRG